MLEQEIKLHLPAADRPAVLKQLAQQEGARRVRLRAMYFDTADRQLSRQHAALRLRLEGRRWVQTFKMAMADSLSRLEVNHPRPGPELDLSVYEGTPAAAVISGLKGKLLVRYETDVMRLTRQVKVRGGVVEIACDEGVVRAGDVEVPMSELEFELIQGKPTALFALAERWQRQHGLVLDLRSKAERGDALAEAWQAAVQESPSERAAIAWQHFATPYRQMGRALIGPADTAELALRRVTADCLDQIVRNSSLITANDGRPVSAEVRAEAVHQWRIGVRRLRSAWQLFRDITPLPPQAWRDLIGHVFAVLGAGRDQHLMGVRVVPELVQAGMPPLMHTAPTETDHAAESVLLGAEYRQWLLDMQAWTVLPAADTVKNKNVVEPTEEVGNSAAVSPSLVLLLGARLQKWHNRMVRQGRRFQRLSVQERHDLRKLVKRVRYGLSFTESLWPERRLQEYRQQLLRVQDVLGVLNDESTAAEYLRNLALREPQAWFGVGWLAAGLPKHCERAVREFRQLKKMRPFWGKRLDS